MVHLPAISKRLFLICAVHTCSTTRFQQNKSRPPPTHVSWLENRQWCQSKTFFGSLRGFPKTPRLGQIGGTTNQFDFLFWGCANLSCGGKIATPGQKAREMQNQTTTHTPRAEIHCTRGWNIVNWDWEEKKREEENVETKGIRIDIKKRISSQHRRKSYL